MKKAIAKLCCFLILFLVVGCSLDSDDENFQFTTIEAVSADFPESFQLNGNYVIDVVLRRINGCVFFERFEVTAPEPTTRVISAIGTMLTDEPCTEAIEAVSYTHLTLPTILLV